MANDGLLFTWMGRGSSDRTRHHAWRSRPRRSWSSALVLTGTYGVIVSRVVYTEWIFFGALALGAIDADAAGDAMRPSFLRRRISGRADRCSRSMCLAIVVNQIVGDPRNSLTGLAHCHRRPSGLLLLETRSCP